MFRFKFSSLALFAALTACASHPTVVQTEPVDANTNSVTFVIPSLDPPPSNAFDLTQRLRFFSYRSVVRNKYPDPPIVNSMQWNIQPTGFSVERFTATVSDTSDYMKVSVSYDGKIEMTNTGNSYRLVFSPQIRKSYAQAHHRDGTPYYDVSLTTAELTDSLRRAELTWKFDVDSAYSSEATYANFLRLTRKESFQNGWRDPVTGKIFKERFWIRVGGRETSIAVETYPYRTGSKAVVYTSLTGVTSAANTVDFIAAARAVRQEVERIMESK